MKPRSLIAAAVGALVLSPLYALAPASADPGAAPGAATVVAKPRKAKLVLKASVGEATASQSITLRAKTPRTILRSLSAQQKRRAKLVVERRDGSRWAKVAVVKKARAKASVGTTVPSAAVGKVSYKATLRLGKRTLATGKLALAVRATTPPPVATLSAALASTRSQDPISWAVTATPAQAGRTVRIEQYVDGAWAVVGTEGAIDAAGSATLTAAALGYPTWLRVVAPAWQGNPQLSVAAVRTTVERVPSLVAHRAGAGVAPEQTLAAVRAAVATGVPAMEIDVQLTSDGVPIIVHDGDFKRTTNVEEVFPADADKPIGFFTLDQVKQLDAGSWFGPQWAGEKIPTLDEVVAELGSTTRLVLEIKSPEAPGNDQVDEVLTTQLASGPLGDLAAAHRLTVSSFGLKNSLVDYDLTWLAAFATAHPDVPVAALTNFSPTTAQLDQWEDWAEEVHANVTFINRAAVDAARARGLEVSVWTPNSASAFRKALSVGADAVITDFTDQLAGVLEPAAPPA